MPDAGATSSPLVRDVEERAFNAWPALETRLVGGWIIRFGQGYTKRANSVNAWRPDVPLADIIDEAGRLYASRGLPLIVRLSPLAEPGADAFLAARGFARIDESIVLTAPLTAVARNADAAVTVLPAPASAWLDGFALANAVPDERRAVHDAMVGRIAGPAGFATLDEPSAPIAWGLAAVERGMVGLFDIVTSPAARRRGAARRLVGHLLHWAAGRGATSAYLQVVAANSPALALYQSLGFVEAYRYHYRIAPPSVAR